MIWAERNPGGHEGCPGKCLSPEVRESLLAALDLDDPNDDLDGDAF